MAQKFCTNCGALLNEGDGFCNQCGSVIASASAQPTADAQPTSQQTGSQQPYNQQAPYQQAPQQPMNPQGGYYYPPNGYPNSSPYGNQPIVMMKPKIRGRGFGIASMVLGIIALVFALSLFSSAQEVMSEYEELYDEYKNTSYMAEIDDAYQDGMEDHLSSLCVFTVLSILSVVFGFCAKSRGYRCGVSTAGLILGFLSMAAYAASIVFVVLQIV